MWRMVVIHHINHEIVPIITMAEAPIYVAGELRCSQCEQKCFQCYVCLDRQKEMQKQKRKRPPPKSPDKKLIEEHNAVMKVMVHALENAEEGRKEEARKQSILRQQAEELKAVQKEQRRISALQKKAGAQAAEELRKSTELDLSDDNGTCPKLSHECDFPFPLSSLRGDVDVRMTDTKGRGLFATRKLPTATEGFQNLGRENCQTASCKKGERSKQKWRRNIYLR